MRIELVMLDLDHEGHDRAGRFAFDGKANAVGVVFNLLGGDKPLAECDLDLVRQAALDDLEFSPKSSGIETFG